MGAHKGVCTSGGFYSEAGLCPGISVESVYCVRSGTGVALHDPEIWVLAYLVGSYLLVVEGLFCIS